MFQRNARAQDSLRAIDFILITIIFSLMGAFFWAIRGTGGYGGSAGGLLAGLGWAMLWLGFSYFGGAPRMRPYGNGYMVAAITLGMAVGGMTGYGVYIGWLQGQFYLDYPNGLREVAPWTGFVMLFFCGLHWGGVTGVFMAWCAPKRPLAAWEWCARIGAGVACAVLAGYIVRVFPQWFLPFYSEGLYAIEANKTCIRAEDSIRTIAPHVGLFAGFLAFEIARRDWRAVRMMLLMSMGFAIPFTIGGIWQTYNSVSDLLPWWKFWEMSIGLGGGLAFGIAFWLFNRVDAAAAPEPVTKREQIFAVMLVTALAAASVVSNAYQGFSDLHELNWPGGPRQALTLLTLAAGAAGFALWRREQQQTQTALQPDTPILPYRTPSAAIGLIFMCGYIVSIPGQWHPHNTVLLTAYTAYLLVSVAALAGLMVRRGA